MGWDVSYLIISVLLERFLMPNSDIYNIKRLKLAAIFNGLEKII